MQLYHLLYIGTDVADYQFTVQLLEYSYSHRFTVDFCSDPRVATEKASDKKFHLCLLADESTTETFLKMLEDHPNPKTIRPMILLTDKLDPSSDGKYSRSNITSSLPKHSLSPIKMESEIIKAINKHRFDQQQRRADTFALQSRRAECLATLMGSLAHDLNNALVSILGNSHLMLDSLPPDSPLRESLSTIEAAGNRAGEIVSFLLSLALDQTPQLHALDLARLLKETTRLLTFSFGQHLHISLEVEPNLPLAQADVAGLQLMLVDLLLLLTQNKEDFSLPPVSVLIKAGTLDAKEQSAISLTVTGQDHYHNNNTPLFIEIVSSAFGELAKSWDKITSQGELDISQKDELTSLRLLHLVERLHGAGSIQTMLGGLTKILLALPAAEADRASSPNPTDQKKANKGQRILVIDEEPSVQKVCRSILEMAGFLVVCASNESEAFALFKEDVDGTAAVIIDLTIKGKSGFDVLNELRRLQPTLPAVIASGFLPELPFNFSGSGQNLTYLPKPFTSADLLEAVRCVTDCLNFSKISGSWARTIAEGFEVD